MNAGLLIALAIALALAPLWHFLPSPRQRVQLSLRERAAVAGLYVELRDLPLPQARLDRLPAGERQVLYYGLRLPPRRGRARQARVWWREGDGWRGTDGGGQPPGPVASLPSWALALAIDETSCGVYWRETAGPEAVDAIVDALRAWRDGEG